MSVSIVFMASVLLLLTQSVAVRPRSAFMAKAIFAILVIVSTIAALGAVAHRYNFQFSPEVHPFVVVYKTITTHEAPGQGPRTDSDRYITFAVRSDGATMKANAIPDAQRHLATVRSIEFKDRYVVVDPFTNSVSTYAPYLPLVSPSQDCGGAADKSVLGYRTEIVTENPPAPSKGNRQFISTKWLAVDLKCVAMRELLVVDDGSEVVKVDRQAISINSGEPPTEYFEVPSNYEERGPADIDNEVQKKSPGHHVFGGGDSGVLDKLQRTYENARPPQPH